jgi:hypothetical protein
MVRCLTFNELFYLVVVVGGRQVRDQRRLERVSLPVIISVMQVATSIECFLGQKK